jgi:CubicO group peptidase (beta-lactamase class C family)
MEGYLGDEPPRAPVWIAGADLARTDTGLDPLNSPFWYSLALPWGGLVTTAAGALTLVRAFAGRPTGFLSPELLADATRDQTGGLAGARTVLQGRRGRWGLGVELRGDQARHWTPAEASPTSFGHVGTSGCLAWVDPTVNVAWAMLGARYFVDWWRDWPAIGAAILAACR